jgi:hypothetical protein
LRDSDELFNASRYVVFLVRLAGLPSGQDTQQDACVLLSRQSGVSGLMGELVTLTCKGIISTAIVSSIGTTLEHDVHRSSVERTLVLSWVSLEYENVLAGEIAVDESVRSL